MVEVEKEEHRLSGPWAFSADSKPEVDQAGKKQPVPRDLRTGPTVSFAVHICYCLCEVFVEAAANS